MARNVELLLLKTVENLGIVGDVVRVKAGHARNYLLPFSLAEPPTPVRIEQLKMERAKAQAELQRLRGVREQLVEQLREVTIRIERRCNDRGALYGSVTQRDISDALQEAGFGVDMRSLRLSHPLRRIGAYTVPIQFDKDLRIEITLTIKADRELDGFTKTGEPTEAPEPQAEGADDREAGKDEGKKRSWGQKKDADEESEQSPAVF